MNLHRNQKEIDINKGEVLFSDFHKLDYVYYVLEGSFKICKYTEDGNEKIVDILSGGDYLAVTLIFSDNEVYGLSCIALSDSKILKVTVEEMYESLATRTILKDYMNFTSRKLLNFKNYLASYTELDERIMMTLMELYSRFGYIENNCKKLDLPMSKTDLASFIGLRRETLSRKLGILVEKGLIEVNKNQIIIK